MGCRRAVYTAGVLTRPFGPTRVKGSVIGQGTWHMGQDRRLKKDEIAALRLGIEKDVVPHCERERIAVVGYTPLARGGFMRGAVADVAKRLGKTPRPVTLNFLTRRPSLFAIPKATRPEHVRQNAGALDFTLTPEDLSAIDAEHRR